VVPCIGFGLLTSHDPALLSRNIGLGLIAPHVSAPMATAALKRAAQQRTVINVGESQVVE